MKHYYRVYGLNLESTIEIPEFEIIDNNCNVDVNLSYGYVNEEIKELIATGHSCDYKKQNMWFNIPDTAIFHIFNGDTVVIEPYENADLNMVKIYIMGSVLGMVLLQKNKVAIHGGGIIIDGNGCIFTGKKGAGKSTITTALRKKGYKFVADDVCAVNSGEINEIDHGFAYQKLCEDTMGKLGYNIDEFKPFRGDLGTNKYIVPAFDEFSKEEVPLKVIFELSEEDVEHVEVEEVLGADKIKKIMENIFRVEMLHYSGGMEPIYFKKCLNIAKNTRLYKIIRPKNVFSVDEQILLVERLVRDNNVCEESKIV